MKKIVVTGFLSVIVVPFMIAACAKSDPVLNEEPPPPSETVLTKPSVTTMRAEGITSISAKIVAKVTANGNSSVTSRGICWATTPEPTIQADKMEATTISGSGEFESAISGLSHSTVYYVRSYVVNAAGIAYGNEIQFKTEALQKISFLTKPMFIIGANRVSYDVEIPSDGGATIQEMGICWSVDPDPTVEDNKITNKANEIGKHRYTITGLAEKSIYHLRGYVITEEGISYSSNITFKTIAKGNITYTFNKSESPTPEQLVAYGRLQESIDSAVWYLNNYTSAVKHVWVNFDPNVPTADANNEGWMRFGSNPDSQNLRTMLHELNHTLGTGTTNWWRNQAISNGVYQLTHANQMLRYIAGNETEQLKGDGMHWWPYGLNYTSEVKSSWDFVYNCLLIEAMRKDGLTHSGPIVF